MLDILNGLRRCWEEKRPAALATILAVHGSTYRREGTRCLIHDDGQITGIVSGGCVEKDLFEHAQSVIETGVSKAVEYDFRPADDVLWGLGLGCNGKLTIWIQPFDPVKRPDLARNLLDAFERRVSSEISYVAGTVVKSKDETRIPIGQVVYPADGRRLEDAQTVLTPHLIDGVEVELFVERVDARPRLVIFGAGADVKPLTRAAKFVQWHVTVVDHRPDVLHKGNFPDADQFIVTTREDYGNVEIPKTASVVIMTHNYEFDKSAIRRLLPQDIAYLGQLGPRKRLERMLGELESAGCRFEPTHFEKLHSPIGLDIGAETAEEIALCIVTEISAWRSGRSGTSLRKKVGQIHASNARGEVADEEYIHS